MDDNPPAHHEAIPAALANQSAEAARRLAEEQLNATRDDQQPTGSQTER